MGTQRGAQGLQHRVLPRFGLIFRVRGNASPRSKPRRPRLEPPRHRPLRPERCPSPLLHRRCWRRDKEPGTDSWALSRDLISMTPLGLMSDLPASAAAATERVDPRLTAALGELADACAAADGVRVATPDAEQGITAQSLA